MAYVEGQQLTLTLDGSDHPFRCTFVEYMSEPCAYLNPQGSHLCIVAVEPNGKHTLAIERELSVRA